MCRCRSAGRTAGCVRVEHSRRTVSALPSPASLAAAAPLLAVEPMFACSTVRDDILLLPPAVCAPCCSNPSQYSNCSWWRGNCVAKNRELRPHEIPTKCARPCRNSVALKPVAPERQRDGCKPATPAASSQTATQVSVRCSVRLQPRLFGGLVLHQRMPRARQVR